MSDRATRQSVGDAKLRKREGERCITRVDGVIVRYYRDVRDRWLREREGKRCIPRVDGVIGNGHTLAAQRQGGRLVSEGANVVYKGDYFKNAGQRNPHVRL